MAENSKVFIVIYDSTVPERVWMNDAEITEGVFIRDFRVEVPLDILKSNPQFIYYTFSGFGKIEKTATTTWLYSTIFMVAWIRHPPSPTLMFSSLFKSCERSEVQYRMASADRLKPKFLTEVDCTANANSSVTKIFNY